MNADDVEIAVCCACVTKIFSEMCPLLHKFHLVFPQYVFSAGFLIYLDWNLLLKKISPIGKSIVLFGTAFGMCITQKHAFLQCNPRNNYRGLVTCKELARSVMKRGNEPGD